MDPILDTTCLHELVDQRAVRLQRAATAHNLGSAEATLSPAASGRARLRIAAALRHLAERVEPHRLEAPALTR